jgi:hypothetical protein
MPSRSEVASELAQLIKSGSRASRIKKSATYSDLTLSDLGKALRRRDSLLSALRTAADRLDGLVHKGTNRRLSESDRAQILAEASIKLGIKNKTVLAELIKSANNENALALTELLNQLMSELDAQGSDEDDYDLD